MGTGTTDTHTGLDTGMCTSIYSYIIFMHPYVWKFREYLMEGEGEVGVKGGTE